MTAIDERWLQDALVQLLRTPSQVPFGETEIQPGDRGIWSAVDEVVMPWIEESHPDELRRHPDGDVAARFGPPGNDGLLIQTYIVSQHANLMDRSASGDIVEGADVGLEGPSAAGQGASQNKGPMASAFAAVKARPPNLQRPLWLAVNTEGRSSHGGSQRIIDDLEVTAAQGIVAFGTDLRVSLGNRGRVDVEIVLSGRSCHSSQPWLGDNPIEPGADVVSALRSLPLPEADPALGPSTATPYRFACFPVAPHTIPEEVRIVVDRRLLPGEEPDRAVSNIRRHLESCGITAQAEQSVHMLPAKVDKQEPVVCALVDGIAQIRGSVAQTFYSLNAFDAGYACSRGIPTPMFGPGKRRFGEGMLGPDAVTLADCNSAAHAMSYAIAALCR